jgi:hypothetical protein
MSPEKLVTHEPIAVKRDPDPEDIKEGISGWAEESKEKQKWDDKRYKKGINN